MHPSVCESKLCTRETKPSTCILPTACLPPLIQARIQPSDNGVGGHFTQILDLFQGLKIGVPSGCLGKTSIFKIIVIDDVTFIIIIIIMET